MTYKNIIAIYFNFGKNQILNDGLVHVQKKKKKRCGGGNVPILALPPLHHCQNKRIRIRVSSLTSGFAEKENSRTKEIYPFPHPSCAAFAVILMHFFHP